MPAGVEFYFIYSICLNRSLFGHLSVNVDFYSVVVSRNAEVGVRVCLTLVFSRFLKNTRYEKDATYYFIWLRIDISS